MVSLHSLAASRRTSALNLLAVFGSVSLKLYSDLGLSVQIVSNYVSQGGSLANDPIAQQACVPEHEVSGGRRLTHEGSDSCTEADDQAYYALTYNEWGLYSESIGYSCGLASLSNSDCATGSYNDPGSIRSQYRVTPSPAFSLACSRCNGEHDFCSGSNCFAQCISAKR